MNAPGISPLHPWQNWSRSLPPSAAQIVAPATQEELQSLVRSQTVLRPVGAGHSWTGLVPNDQVIVDMRHFATVSDGTPQANGARIWLGAGARLHDLSSQMATQNLAFRNLGDIDVQSLAGAVSTATHGTGRSLPCLAAEITAIRLIDGTGTAVEISASQNADMLPAAQVALGSLGIFTDIEMQVVPSHRLHRHVWFAPLATLLADAETLWNKHRNFEFFYIPFSDHAMAITHDVTQAAVTPRQPDESDAAVRQLKFVRDVGRWLPPLRRWLLRKAIGSVPRENVIGESWRLLASARNIPFNEMEYHIDADRGLDCFAEVVHCIESKHSDVFFPIEVRRTAGDTALMSPFCNGEKISIAVHCYHREAYAAVFADVEAIFKRFGGRPHWGKMHTLTHRDLRTLYPEFEAFNRIRRALDPQGRFVNAYLAQLWGETGCA